MQLSGRPPVVLCFLQFNGVRSVFRSTPPSQPNNITGGNVHPSVGTSVRTYVRPQKVFLFAVKFGV